ncbi:Nucleotidylyl transferase [Basidiobolus meristosporus CBS 931.73]|uniref:Nicotinamide-nucleotide adenylyltransferase n=1 Tax=Basidiobolus meristosporus CBS 931.73 TaxID=1314790 RepID=A0A1Y1Y5T4_9FUNG|nr:Nucleotidylyl transferase [Basidiobolus meristosporus CBS 931.73]|eukprot:ORX92954.1 Nucleotidylyl transferase [Basidiobolus meristosporus CBS 931.73]
MFPVDESKIPLVLVACGSFSPITYLHLRMFEMAKDQIEEEGKYELLGGYFSPVNDKYGKKGLASAVHRVHMCEEAVEKTSDWIMVDSWEATNPTYQRTAVVLDHFNQCLNGSEGGGVLLSNGQVKTIRIMLLAGGDLIESFGVPDCWVVKDLHHILGVYGCVVVERTGTDVYNFLLSHDVLNQYRKNVRVVKQLIHNDISSTKIRLFIKRGMSIKYLLPNEVIDYITQHKLYLD